MEGVELRQWRRTERERLIAERMALPATARRLMGERIAGTLQSVIGEKPGVLGVYWPFRAEFDPRPVIDWAIAAGRGVALPVVVDKRGPLEFRAWRPGEPLVDGVWNIPVPERRDVVIPSIVLAPVVGFDPACYRLGYGGGYFDRTLAALSPRAFAIGVGFSLQAIETIYPQSFDIAMDLIVTETGIQRR
ncbi:MAG TPA: 5-formyltetrahydrofolate cyclo-ligase [Stellaceae bacterium]|jgi:5,10-methenyltetrahydrofolate synthetase|nr:5-formyltetrahydrofolate cyclo-ligase [Stellaceae bacterium]